MAMFPLTATRTVKPTMEFGHRQRGVGAS